MQFEQCMELQIFNRDCEHANATMTKQEVRTCIILYANRAHSIHKKGVLQVRSLHLRVY